MESVDEYVKQKIGVKDMRNEIKGMKEKIFKNTAVMRQGELNAYLDKLRYVSNLIEAEDSMGGNPKKYLKEEHMELDSKKHKEPKHKEPKHKEIMSESDSDSSDDEKPIKKKIIADVKLIEKKIAKESKETPKEVKKEHKSELKTLEDIPKQLHKLVKDKMKADGHKDVMRAYRKVKKEL